MKKKLAYILSLMLPVIVAGCQGLDLNPLSSGSSGNWYSTEDEIVMALRDLYRAPFWPVDSESWTDDYTSRDNTGEIIKGTLNGQSTTVTDYWSNHYKMICRAVSIIKYSDRALENGLSQEKVDRYIAEAKFLRACAYSKLTEKFGDVPYVEDVLTIEQSFAYGRTPVAEINQHIYEDFDAAIAALPEKYSGEQRATKYAAMAFKARHALYMGDWEIAAQTARTLLDANAYSLHKDFGDLFVSVPSSPNTDEVIFKLARSRELKINVFGTRDHLPRIFGGYAVVNPSWDLLASFLCTDGLTVDKSPLFDSHDPFKNRDPRCEATIVRFGSDFMGAGYDPSPLASKLYNYKTGKYDIQNLDTRYNQFYASYNGLIWRKSVDETWMTDYLADNDLILIRLAEIYLIYAEARIEMNEIDKSVLDAINTVRSRAYGTTKDKTSLYPEVKTTDQTELRRIVRTERRMEFAMEGLRYMDLVRWKLASVSLTRKNYGMIYPMSTNNSYMSNWFWASAPKIDENGLPDFSELEQQNKIMALSERTWNDRQYLWPLPTTDMQLNENLRPNNPGY